LVGGPCDRFDVGCLQDRARLQRFRRDHEHLAAARVAAQLTGEQTIKDSGSDRGHHERNSEQLQQIVLFHDGLDFPLYLDR